MQVLVISHGSVVDGVVERTLQNNGYEVVAATSDSSLGILTSRVAFDLIVVDIERTGPAGVSMLVRVRRLVPTATILMLSPEAAPDHRVLALDAGADDCLSRPFDSIELHARIKALMRRRCGNVLHLGNLAWHWQHRQGEVDSRPLSLSRFETALIETLLKSPGQIVPMEFLARRIEATDDSSARNRLYVYICRLRKKLSGADIRIRSASGLGYWIDIAR